MRGTAGVYSDNGAPVFFSFVLQEAPQLSEAPGVHAPTGFPASLFGSRTDVYQVLDNNGRSWLDTLNNTPTDNVVAILAKPIDLSAKLPQVLLGGLGAFALKIAFQPKAPSIHFLPLFLAVEIFIGYNGRSREAKVYSNNLPVRDKFDIEDSQNDVQKEPALAVEEIGGVETCALGEPSFTMRVRSEGNKLPTGHRRKTCAGILRGHSVRPGVIANRNIMSLRTGHLAALRLKRQSRFDRFGGLHSRSTDKLRGKVWKPLSKLVVGLFVQSHAIGQMLTESKLNNHIEAFRVLLHRFKQYGCLFFCRIQLQANGSLHAHILTDIGSKVNTKGGCALPLPPEVGSLRARSSRR